MEATWIGIAPTPAHTRVLAMSSPVQTILKAHLRTDPSSPRALATLLEGLALWEGRRVRAALVVDERSSCAGGLLREAFPMFGDSSSLVDLTWVDRRTTSRADGIRGMGRFADLEQLVRRTLAR